MSVLNRIAAAQILLERSRAFLTAFENGRRIGIALALSPGVSLLKSETLPNTVGEPKEAQKHRTV
ncbi:MAG: hypothetical protein EON54_00275 [Alcaligenaceae bacterium]|nr:MAG: hypothetical protein EON54_00275 [Alcaligenaceae bacterium]